MDPRLTLITLGVSDVQKATAFYEEKIGWKRRPGMSNDNISFFQLNGILLSLFSLESLAKDATVPVPAGGNDPTAFRGMTLAYVCRSEQEVDDIMKSLEAKGVKIVKQPTKVFWGGYSGYFADLDGNLWEVAYNPFLALDEKGNVAA
eukprot:Nitzschia sp. Nitz4//scaffold167_size49223//48019//48459//NITZ4_007042-RA/size49223-processed-gene-0.52-mRNA-1//1//CDS//3329538296//6674//frame0